MEKMVGAETEAKIVKERMCVPAVEEAPTVDTISPHGRKKPHPSDVREVAVGRKYIYEPLLFADRSFLSSLISPRLDP